MQNDLFRSTMERGPTILPTMSRPLGIDLFAGAGGLSLGFEQAGFDVVAAVEIDPVHAAVHEYNFPHCRVIPRSVTELSGATIRAAAGIGERTVDVVFGGAPCQGFSLIGQRALDDPRNSLVKDFVRIVRELDASYFVFENVKGLTVGKHRKFLVEIIEEFKIAGYDVVENWKVLNACSYGVPQDRQRLFLLGAKRGLPLPSYPIPTTRKPGTLETELPTAPTCLDALSDLPDAERFARLNGNEAVRVTNWNDTNSYASRMRCLDSTGWEYGYKRDWNPAILTSSARSNHSDISRERFASTPPGEVEPVSRFFKLHPEGVSNTLRAGTDSARGAFTSPRPIHYKWNRCITVREMARLHGFPDWFRFNGTKWHGARQIGNAVPPPLARSVASEVMRALGIKPQRPRKVVSLGDDALLRFGTTEAAAYWGIANPIGRRDKKSGIKKRKQSEISPIASLNLTP
ncbi:DNA cytosine methyltransferase [Xanthomonas hortorum]|uniref:DNA cytosine methyltransferase n=2 Tax=Xanthomonas hortorum TaxID=56454 RepID=UPI002B4BA373|nr:DNA cytosine methyltransferase [Xanthomonas hortorum]